MTPEEIVNDFARRYQGTYVFVQDPNDNEESLFYMDRVEPSPTKTGVIHLSSGEVGRIRLNLGSAHTLKFIPAPVGVFQHGPMAYLCLRKPARQWRRGICPDNTTIVPTTRLLARNADAGFTYDLVSDAFRKQTLGIKAALEMLASKKYKSVALADNFSLSLALTNSPDYLLFFWDLPVAKVKSDGSLSLILENAFSAQIKKVLEA